MNTRRAGLEAFIEPTARAVRRGDPDQLLQLASSIREFYSLTPLDTTPYEQGCAIGVMRAIEGIIAIASERADSDQLHSYLTSRKRAIPILQALAQRRWKHHHLADKSGYSASYSMTQLSERTGVLKQNLPALIKELFARNLISVENESREKRAEITDEGIAALDLASPNWQMEAIERFEENKELDEAIERFRVALATLPSASVRQSSIKSVNRHAAGVLRSKHPSNLTVRSKTYADPDRVYALASAF